MSRVCIEVPGRSTAWIRNLAQSLREATDQTQPWFEIVRFMDVYLTKQWPDYELQVEEKEVLGRDAGLTYPDRRLVVLRCDVYEDAARGGGFGRFTMAHELGHLLMHTGVGFARQVNKTTVPPYRDSEVQANRFAAELLMPVKCVQNCGSTRDLQSLCGVSFSAASSRIKSLIDEGIRWGCGM